MSDSDMDVTETDVTNNDKVPVAPPAEDNEKAYVAPPAKGDENVSMKGDHKDETVNERAQSPLPSISQLSSFESPVTNSESPATPSSANAAKKRKRLTPDERLSRDRERAEKRQKLEEEKQRKEEEKRKRELERVEKLKAKEQERVEKERIKEQERLKREEVKEQERLKREEENAKRAEEKRKKEEERIKKEEERLKKEEERVKKEEERRKQLEEKEKERQKLEEKKAKQAEHFTKFFQKSPLPTSKVRTLSLGNIQPQPPTGAIPITNDAESDKENKETPVDLNVAVGADNACIEKNEYEQQLNIKDEEIEIVHEKKAEVALFSPMPFQIKTHMAVAPLIRRPPGKPIDRALLDKCYESTDKKIQSESNSREEEKEDVSDFLVRCKRKEGMRSERTLVEYTDEDADMDVSIVMEDEDATASGKKNLKMKLLHFHDNRRPAYFGTWRRRSQGVTPRRPFGKDKELDYEFDSDDEWEDEPEDAEEIEHSDGEEEKPEDPAEGEPLDEEDEEGWMVPHGYLSDSEREGEHVDIETIKNKEQEFYKSLKEKVKASLPLIQTEGLSEFAMIFPLLLSRKIRRSVRSRKPTSKDQHTKGFLALELPSDDEEDCDWNENAPSSEREDGGGLESDSSSIHSSSSEGEDSDDEDDDESDMEYDKGETTSEESLIEDNSIANLSM